MITLSATGLERLKEFVFTYGTQHTKDYYSLGGIDAHIESIDDDGHLELGAAHSEDSRPHTIKFSNEDLQS